MKKKLVLASSACLVASAMALLLKRVKYYFDFLHNIYFGLTGYFNKFTYVIHFLQFIYK